ncbi:hypothetical protein ACE6H2_001649 [Prunus campanulata]
MKGFWPMRVGFLQTSFMLIPNLVYADPRSRLETADAFDLAVKGILERIEDVREVIREGKDPSIGFADEDSYKYTFPQTQEQT